jgi:hypothetical protein
VEWGPTEGTGGGPSLYEPRPAYQFLVKNIVESSRVTPDVPGRRPAPGVDLRHVPFGLARRWWNQRFHPGMAWHRQHGGSVDNSTRSNSPKSMQAARRASKSCPILHAPEMMSANSGKLLRARMKRLISPAPGVDRLDPKPALREAKVNYRVK